MMGIFLGAVLRADKMDIDEQFEFLLGPDYTDMDPDEQRRQLEALLDTDGYIPASQPSGQANKQPADQSEDSTIDVVSRSIDPDTDELYNPGLEAYREHVSWTEFGWGPVDETGMFPTYPEYLPTDEAIQTVSDYSPLVDVAAGNGYWAHVITENGGDCIATDLNAPRAVDSPPETITFDADGERLPFEKTVWAAVREADHTVVTEYPNRDVLLCHPPVQEWTEELLSRMEPSQRLVLVAEWYPGADATPLFFHTLNTKWTLCDEFPVYNWKTTHAHGYVFEKSVTA